MIYGDTSFVLAIYREVDKFHAEARRLASKAREPFPLTLLLELEIHNGLHRALATGNLTLQQHAVAFRHLAKDEADGILVRRDMDSPAVYARALELSKRFTPQIPIRTLDILHVAAALLLQASEFASFDDRQRLLAGKAGLKLLPR